MWLLRGEGDIDGQTYYLHEGTFLVGRAAPDIAIALLVDLWLLPSPLC